MTPTTRPPRVSVRHVFWMGALVWASGACDIPVPTPPFALQPAVAPSFACNASDAVNARRQTRVVLRPAGSVGFSLSARASLDGVTATLPAVSLLTMDGREIPLRSVELATPGEMALWITARSDGGRPLAPGDYTVVVRSNDRAVTTARGALHVVAPPTLAAVATVDAPAGAPAVACADGGSRIRVTGSGFRAGAVTVALTREAMAPLVIDDASVSIPSPDSLEFSVPAGVAVGRYGVRIISRDGDRDPMARGVLDAWPQGCEALLPDALAVETNPTLAAVELGERCADGVVRIVVRGDHLRDGDTFSLGGAPLAPDRVALDMPAGDGTFRRATLTVASARLLGASPYPVAVRGRGGCVASVGVACPAGTRPDGRGLCSDPGGVVTLPPSTVTAAPRVRSVVAPRVCAPGPLAVMVRGENFFGALRVTFADLPARAVTVEGTTTLLAEFDVTEALAPRPSPRALRVAPSLACAGEASFSVPASPAMAFDAVTPDRVCLGDAPATVSLQGEGLGAAREVTVGGIPAEVERISDDRLRVTVPAGVVDGASVEVAVGPDDGCGPARRSLRVEAPARVTTVVPVRSCAEGGFALVALGDHLGAASALAIDGEAVTPERVLQRSDHALRIELTAALTEGPHELSWSGCGGASIRFVWATPGGDAALDRTAPVTVAQGAPSRVRIEGAGAASFASFALLGADGRGGPVALSEVTPLDADTVVATVVGAAPGGPYALEGSDGRCRAQRADAVTVVAPRGLTVARVAPTVVPRGRTTRVTVEGAGWSTPPRLHLARGGSFVEVAPIPGGPGVVAFDAPPSLAEGRWSLVVSAAGGVAGSVSEALQVVARPPRIKALVPAVVSGATVSFAIFGEGFVEPRVGLRFPGEDIAATRVRWSPSLAVVTLDANLLQGGVWPVRLTNLDGSFAEGASIRLASQGAACEVHGARLTTPREGHGVVVLETHDGGRHLLALGGDGGAGTSVRDDTELATIDADGALGPWRVQRNRLPAPRAGISRSTFVHAGHVYVVGGRDAEGRAVDTVWRAPILDVAGRPVVRAEATTVGAGALAPGVWLYRVAVLRGSDASEESVASEAVAVRCEARCAVGLRWAPVAGALRYRVYRSPAVDGDARELTSLTVVDGPRWTDDGSVSPAAGDVRSRPLDPGSTGPWRALDVRLLAARTGAAAVMVRGADDRAVMLVAGGRGEALRDDLERSPWEPSRGDFGAFVRDEHTMVRPQEDLTALAVTQDEVPWMIHGARVFLLGGRGVDASVVPAEGAAVMDGGALAGWRPTTATLRTGAAAVAMNASIVAFGGEGTGATALCRASVDVDGSPSDFSCAAGGPLAMRRGAAVVRVGARVYLVGGHDGGAAVTEVLRCTP